MNRLRTNKLDLRVVNGEYLHLTVFTDDEINTEDIPAVVAFLDQFDRPVPILIERKGSYSISVRVQMAMYTGTKSRLKAVAYVDRDHRDTLLSRIAQATYFKHTIVKSFQNESSAVNWLRSYCDEPIETSRSA